MKQNRSIIIGLSVIGGVSMCVAIPFVIGAWDTISAMAPVLSVFFAGVLVLIGGSVAARQLSGAYTTIHVDKTERKTVSANHQFDMQRQALEMQEQMLRLTAQVEMLPEMMRQIALDLAMPRGGVAGIEMKEYPAMVARKAQQAIQPPIQSALKPLMHELQNADNILVVGAKGTGKTSLLQHIEHIRRQYGKIIVLDSHAQPSQWQGDVIGIGRQYETIKTAMVNLTNRLHGRYQRWAKGESTFEPIHTFIDEFTLLPDALKQADYDVQQYSIPALTEGRKVRMNCIWGIHSDRVKAMGLEGKGDIKECFDAVVYLKHNAQTDERYALVDFGDGVDKDTRYAHPGPFVIHGQAQTVTEAAPMLLDAPPALSILDGQVIEAEIAAYEEYISTNSLSAAWRKLYFLREGKKFGSRPNSTQLSEIRAIIARLEGG